jgi:hypothetical protein
MAASVPPSAISWAGWVGPAMGARLVVEGVVAAPAAGPLRPGVAAGFAEAATSAAMSAAAAGWTDTKIVREDLMRSKGGARGLGFNLVGTSEHKSCAPQPQYLLRQRQTGPPCQLQWRRHPHACPAHMPRLGTGGGWQTHEAASACAALPRIWSDTCRMHNSLSVCLTQPACRSSSSLLRGAHAALGGLSGTASNAGDTLHRRLGCVLGSIHTTACGWEEVQAAVKLRVCGHSSSLSA